MGKQTGKLNIALLAAAVLLCLNLFITHLVGGLYARYTTTAESSDGARVAKFSVTSAAVQNNPETIILTQDNPEVSYTFTISGDTETAWEYGVIIKQKNGEQLPGGITMTLVEDNVGIAIPLEFEETRQLGEGYAYRIKTVQSLPAGSHSAQYTIFFTADYDVLTKTVTLEDLEISVQANQID